MLMKSSTFITKWVYAVIRITVIWWLFNFPYLYLIVAMLGVKNSSQLSTLIFTGVILIPFVLFPASITSLGIGREFHLHENDFSLFRMSWKYYKREYVNGLKLGFVFMLLAGLFYLYYSYYSKLSGAYLGFIFIIVAIIVTHYFMMVLTILVDRTNTIFGYLKVSGQLMSRHPLLVITMILETFLTIYLCHRIMPSLLLFVCPGILVIIFTRTYFTCLKQERKNQTLIAEES